MPVPDPPVSPDEDGLLDRAVAGDRDALGTLLERHQDLVYRYLLSLTGEEAEALDLAQETFLKAIRGLSRYRRDAPFRNWLLSIARNEARSGFKSARRRREQALSEGPEPESGLEGADEAVIRSSEIRRIRRALERLPEKQRVSVSLRLFDGLGYREIGMATDSSEGSARVNYHHGIRRLRDELETRPGDGPGEKGDP